MERNDIVVFSFQVWHDFAGAWDEMVINMDGDVALWLTRGAAQVAGDEKEPDDQDDFDHRLSLLYCNSIAWKRRKNSASLT